MPYNVNYYKNKKVTKHTMIITDKIDKLNTYLSIHNNYYEFFDFINIKSLDCPICKSSGLTCHGRYSRQLVDESGDTVTINIYRLKCKCCNKTHAIIPWFIIPYFKLPLTLILEIIGLLKQGISYKEIVSSLLVYDLDLSYIYFIDKKYLLWELFYSNITYSMNTSNIMNIFNTLNNSLKYLHKSSVVILDGRNRIIKYFLHIKLSKIIIKPSPT